MLNNKKIIAVLPAYNASKTLSQTINAIPRTIVDEIILVDDASTDDTYAAASAMGIDAHLHPKNRGYGGNQKTCYGLALERGADIVVMVHPDFQYDPSYIPELITPIAYGSADAVFGSRMLIKRNALRGGMPLWKFIANYFLTILENLMLGLHLSEYHSGFRAYSRNALEKIAFENNSDGFVFDTEIIIQLVAARLTIHEIPILTRYFPEASMIGFFKSIQYGGGIIYSLLRYAGHIASLWRCIQFEPLAPPFDTYCITCNSQRIQVLFPATCDIEIFFRTKSYAIFESTDGIHGALYKCLRCGSQFARRPKYIHELESYYEHQQLDTAYLSDERARRKSFRRILNRLPTDARKDRVFLDIGCGPGLLLSEASRLGFVVTGIDSSIESVRYAHDHLGLPAVRQGSIELVKDIIPDASCDIVAAIDVLEHVAHPNEFLSIIGQKIKSDGICVCTFLMSDSWTARLSGKRWHALLPSHLQYYTQPSLETLLSSCGFYIASAHRYRRYLSLASIIKRLIHNTTMSFPSVFASLHIPVTLDDTIVVYMKKV